MKTAHQNRLQNLLDLIEIYGGENGGQAALGAKVDIPPSYFSLIWF